MKNFEPEKDEDVQKFGAKVICTMFACLILGFLKLNPLLGLPDRAVVVDARIRVSQPHLRSDAKSW